MSYIQADRDTPYLLPPSMDEWLPTNHLARFIVEVIEDLDLSRLTQGYARRGSKAHHPAVLLALLVYGYATGVFSSRKIERASYSFPAYGLRAITQTSVSPPEFQTRSPAFQSRCGSPAQAVGYTPRRTSR